MHPTTGRVTRLTPEGAPSLWYAYAEGLTPRHGAAVPAALLRCRSTRVDAVRGTVWPGRAPVLLLRAVSS